MRFPPRREILFDPKGIAARGVAWSRIHGLQRIITQGSDPASRAAAAETTTKKRYPRRKTKGRQGVEVNREGTARSRRHKRYPRRGTTNHEWTRRDTKVTRLQRWATAPAAVSAKRRILRPGAGPPRRPGRPERDLQFFAGSERPTAIGRRRFPAWPPYPRRLHGRTRDNREVRGDGYRSERRLRPTARCSRTRRPCRRRESAGAPDWPERSRKLPSALWQKAS